MKKENVPLYHDPDKFIELGEDAKFPCDTQYMEYNPMLHRYYLTEEGLSHYGIDFNRRYISSSPNKAQELIQKTSKKVYDYIQYKAGRTCYQIMMYRIATAPKTIYPNQYFMRKQFEEALADQARYLVINSDSAAYSAVDLERGKSKSLPPEEVYRDISDMSPETIRTLETLGLTRWFKVPQYVRLDPNKY